MLYIKNLLRSRSQQSNLLNAVMGGLLVTLPAISALWSAPASAQTRTINPCPRIYYEEPFNSTRRVPQGCPPNAATLEETGQQEAGQTQTIPAPLPTPTPSTTPERAPLPESIQPPTTSLRLTGTTLTIELINNTGTEVTYEVLGQTDQRSIAGRSQVSLRDLQLPLNMTFVRPDGGFVSVTPRESAPGVLSVTLVEAPTVDAGKGAMNVQRDGNVYLN